MVHAHAHEILRACPLVEPDQMVRIKLVTLPGLDDVFEAGLRWVSVVLQVPLVLPLALYVHVARVPVSRFRRRLRPPVRPYAELGVTKPLRHFILLQRFSRALEWAWLDYFFTLRCGKRFCSFKRGPRHGQELERCASCDHCWLPLRVLTIGSDA